MNIQDLKKDFICRFDEENCDIHTFFTGSGLRILGVSFNKTLKYGYSLALSIKTAITLKYTEDDMFYFQLSNSNREFSCDANKLSSYIENGFEKNIFNLINEFKGRRDGAKILFSFDVDDNKFKKFKTSLILGFLSNAILEDNMEYSELYGRKNTICTINKDGIASYIPFNLNDYKVILSTTDMKKENISENIQKSYEVLKKDNPNIKAISDVLLISPERKNIYERYIINESKRCELIKETLLKTNGYIKSVQNLLNESYRELCNIMGKNKIIYENIYNSAMHAGYADGIIITLDYSGVAVFVKNENVDSFITSFTREHEKYIGIKPKLYICDSIDSGITNI